MKKKLVVYGIDAILIVFVVLIFKFLIKESDKTVVGWILISVLFLCSLVSHIYVNKDIFDKKNKGE